MQECDAYERKVKMSAVNYVWDEENDSLLEEVDDNGNVIVSYTNEPGPFGKVISQERNGVTSYYHYDGQGSTLALTDDNGNILTDIAPGSIKRIHLVGVAGTGMGSFAGMLKAHSCVYARGKASCTPQAPRTWTAGAP